LGSAVSRVEYLQDRNVPASLLPVAYSSYLGRLLDSPRDIDVLFIGRTRNRRRIELLSGLEERLRSQGITLTFAPKHTYGEERTRLLNRSRIVVNILNFPWDLTGLRFLMAMSCGALVVTETLHDARPYRAGENIVEVPADKLAEVIVYYLKHEDERAAIAANGYRFATQENTLGKAARRILDIYHANTTVSSQGCRTSRPSRRRRAA
jgi:glycosyltransferase involved in cell wall biosynthesis